MSHLDTILERNSFGSLRTSASMPRLSMSPAKRPKIIRKKDSMRSVHLRHTPWPRPRRLPSIDPHHRRSFSLNDLDCISAGCNLRTNHHSNSSSSGHILDGICLYPSRPLQPVYPPPHRVMTPPGIPSFRTREALELRLEPPQHDSSSIFSLRRRNATPRSFSPESPPESIRSQPMDMLKRMLGINRPITSPPGSSAAERVPIPRHVQALARANDGTYVRGAFGSRASGHGIGRRGLERHPFQVAADRNLDPQASGIEEQVRLIDKACEEPRRPCIPGHTTSAVGSGQGGQPANRETVVTPPCGSEAPPPSPTQARVQALSLASGAISQNSTPALPLSMRQYLARYNVIGSGSGQSYRVGDLPNIETVVASGNPAVDTHSPEAQNPPPPYPVSVLSSPRSAPANLASEDVAGIRDFIVQGECSSARQSVAQRQAVDEKQREPGAIEACTSWCLSCFSSTDNWCNARAWGCMGEVEEMRRRDTQDAWHDPPRRNNARYANTLPSNMSGHAYGRNPGFTGDADSLRAPSLGAIAASQAAMRQREIMVYLDPIQEQDLQQDTRPRRYSNCGARDGRFVRS